MRNGQMTIAEGFFQGRVEDWWEPWMKQVDRVLEDEDLIEPVYRALRRRHRQSATRGRKGFPAEVVLRLLVLKHVRNWSYETLEREVRANLVYRSFTRLGDGKMPDAKTMGRWGLALGPAVIEAVHERLVAIVREKKVVQGRRLRVDTTVTETDIHYPTDSSLLGDGVRVLTRVMKRIATMTGDVGERVRDRTRSVGHRLMEIGRSSRGKKASQGKEKRQKAYQKLLRTTGQVVAQAQRMMQCAAKGARTMRRVVDASVLEGLKYELETMIPRVRQVMRQTKARILGNDIHAPNKIVSVFEPTTEVIRKGKAGKPTEFGKLVKIQEAENQIITHYEVYRQRPSDSELLVSAVQVHQKRLGRLPDLVTADAGFYSGRNETAVHDIGVKRVAVPNRSTKSAERLQHQKQRWFRDAQRWRTGSEGRISVVKRRHGLDRCRYRGEDGVQRWVGLGVIADNLINIGRALTLQPAK